MLRLLAFVAVGALFASMAAAGQPAASSGKRITLDTKWLCYYGDDRRVLDVEGYDLLLVESEGVGEVTEEEKRGRTVVAYMSVGELERYRWYYPDVKDKAWVYDVNPDWPDSRLVDVRSREWQDLVIDEVAQVIMDLGYDGFILDNVDTPEALLRADAEFFAGAADAMVGLINRLRATYPDAVIIANNGLSIVPRCGDALDAMMYEGTQSTWTREGNAYVYGEITPQQKAWQRPRFNRVRAAGVPILALEYADLSDKAEVERIYELCRKAKTNPFVSIRALTWFPGLENLPPLPDDDGSDGEDEEGE